MQIPKRCGNNGEMQRRHVDASCLRPPSIGHYRCLSEQECKGKHGLCADRSGVIEVEAEDEEGRRGREAHKKEVELGEVTRMRSMCRGRGLAPFQLGAVAPGYAR